MRTVVTVSPGASRGGRLRHDRAQVPRRFRRARRRGAVIYVAMFDALAARMRQSDVDHRTGKRSNAALAPLRRSRCRNNQADAILDELCLGRSGAERLIRNRMPQRPSRAVSPS